MPNNVFAGLVKARGNICFVIMPFHRNFDRVYSVISRTAQRAGYTCERADDVKGPGFIPEAILQGIIDADIIVADVSGQNPNVYYELGLSHAVTGNVIILTQPPFEQVPFDLQRFRLIQYEDMIGGDEVLADNLSEALRSVKAEANPQASRARQATSGSLDISIEPVGGLSSSSSMDNDPLDVASQTDAILDAQLAIARRTDDLDLADQLLSELERRIAAGRVDADTRGNTALNAELMGDASRARALFEAALAVNPRHGNNRLMFASFLLDLDNPLDEDMLRVKELLDDSAEAHNPVRFLALGVQTAKLTGESIEPFIAPLLTEARERPTDQNMSSAIAALDDGSLGHEDEVRELVGLWQQANPARTLTAERSLADYLSGFSARHGEAISIYERLWNLSDEEAKSDGSYYSDRAATGLNLSIVLGSRDEPGDGERALVVRLDVYARFSDQPRVRASTARALTSAGEFETASRAIRGLPLEPED